MKKTLSVLLAVILMFSTLGVMAFAEDTTQTEQPMVTIEFYWDAKDLDLGEEPKNIVKIDEKENIIEHFAAYGYPDTPVKESTETTSFKFDGWEQYTEGTEGWVATGNKAYSGTMKLPQGTKNGDTIVFVATFHEEEIKENVSFWALIASIFARFNQIFEYFAKVFEGVF